MSRSSPWAAALLVGCLCACEANDPADLGTTPHPGQGPTAAVTAAPVSFRAVPAEARSTGEWIDGMPTYWSPSFSQRVLLDQWRYVTIENTETVGGTTDTVSYSYSAAFDIHAVAARGTEELYLAGVDDSGELVIVRWSLVPHDGSFAAAFQGSPNPVGTPMTPTTFTQTVVGGSYVPTGQRLPNPRLARTQLFEGTAPGDVVCMNVDPEGRFLLFVGDDSVLYQLELDGASVPVPLYTTSTLWTLPRVSSIRRAQHGALGRLWFLDYLSEVDAAGYGETVWQAVLFDGDNDGVFETFLIDTKQANRSNGYTVGAEWTDDFLYDS